MKKLLIVVGPTATGKTAVSVTFAQKLNGELVSADSRQVYIGMDIGTGKDFRQLNGIPIWMYDIVRPDEAFSVSQYRIAALAALQDIWFRGKLPIMVGGTGFYIDAVLSPPETLDIAPDPVLRKNTEHFTVPQLQDALRLASPGALDTMNNSDRHNARRLVRKIEIAQGMKQKTGKNASMPDVDYKIIGLTAPQSVLYERIDERVDARVAEGIVGEVSGLLDNGYTWDLPSMSGLGYKQWRSFFESSADKSSVVQRWKTDERRYAKRQLNWFRKNPKVEWYDITQQDYTFKMTKSVQAWYTGDENEQ